MTILRIALAIIVSLLVFGLPVWNLARLKGKESILWAVLPFAVFILLVVVSRWAEGNAWYVFFHILKTGMFYVLILSGLLLFVSIIGMIIKWIFKISNTKTFWMIIIATLVFATAARIQGERIVVKKITLPGENITRDYQFVHITDLHHGSTGTPHLERVVEKIRPLNPEFMVITGDFIDENFVDSESISAFNTLDFPQYLITGNHEYYLHENKVSSVLAGSSIQLIDHERITYQELDIIGVNELATVDETLTSVGGLSPDQYSILLDHQPKTDEVHRAASYGTHLMLSGHTHKGQLWPMGILLRLQFKYLAGLYQIDDMFLYVNQGTGTLGPKMRFGTANEITVITLEPTL